VQIGTGYAGSGPSMNDPSCCGQHGVGPLPVGWYEIGLPINDPETGPFSLPLTPFRRNVMLGRGDFLCHGGRVGEPCDSPTAPGAVGGPTARTGSRGCPVADRDLRYIIASAYVMEVIA